MRHENKSMSTEKLLDRFTTKPGRKRKRERHHKQAEKKRRKVVENCKVKAETVFNTPPTPAQRHRWRQLLTPDAVTDRARLAQLLAEAEDLKVEYESTVDRSVPFHCIFELVEAVEKCGQWLRDRLRELGWTENATGYDPADVSASANELRGATLECYKMAVKQLLRLRESD